MFLLSSSSSYVRAETLVEQNEKLFQTMKNEQMLDDASEKSLRAIFSSAPFMGQGNPAVTKHPMTREDCRKEALPQLDVNPKNTAVCGAKYMVPIATGASGSASSPTVCIDQFEFPNIPCEYPLVWTQANEAAAICEAMGKRICDAHEWEGACDGKLLPPDYDFELVKGLKANTAVERMRVVHNQKNALNKQWAYGAKTYQKGICGGNSSKDAKCNGGDWKNCGSNTYPSGAFPKCKSPLGVYDQHGNAAEHMNLPLDASQMASTGSKDLGHTEMKGSWFIFDKFQAHQDWCRWRAPYWHGTRVRDLKSHHNYHLGFRCCKTVSR